MKGRFWLIFGLALVLAVGLFVGSAVWQLKRQAPPTIVWTGLSPLVDFTEAETRARARAQEWSSDVRLVMVEGSWRPTPDWLQTEYLPISWSYTYYSSAQQAMATVGINGEQVMWVPPFPAGQARPAITPLPVPQGPHVAWLSFRAAGGEAFLRAHPNATVKFVLRQAEAGPQWDVLSVADNGESFKVKVDALSGALMP